MDRRLFLSSLLTAAAGATVAYSFPSVIVPKNIERVPLIVTPGVGETFTWFESPMVRSEFLAQLDCDPNAVYFLPRGYTLPKGAYYETSPLH